MLNIQLKETNKMRKLLFILCTLTFITTSCKQDETEAIQNESILKEDYNQEENGYFKEFYGGNDQLKMEGAFDKDRNRDGIWKYYTVDGKTLSVTEYQNGLKNGYSILYSPNGALKYRGEYRADVQIGEWKFYDSETGNLVKTIDYGDGSK